MFHGRVADQCTSHILQVEVAETRIRLTTERVCEPARERGGIRDDAHRLTEEADERQLLLLEEERLRLIEEKELVRLTRGEHTVPRSRSWWPSRRIS